ncbi:glucuronate isomerase [Alkalihalobacillus sp. MEB130]|uniref:glucuronate isomerase n=1 Tax=Alkalihalobacillus sp. MEB130 TaxID=2976704 RepID=UPI0028E01F72|nr:glucuronate isomerase [Alkalihalobacillus sp. MEB130]MDT8859799.1 glucuronate isomerase [Alkalihalobacillus sp. MEB130]
MSKPFIHDDFILNSESAKVLYHDYAKEMPIYDYHCHISPKEIAENRTFSNLSEIWLHGDHYKWRAMRTLGIDERFITGDANDKEKFQAWAKAVPQTIGNPLYHWTHMELKRYFDVDILLNEESSVEVWNHCNQILKNGLTTQKILEKFSVRVVCTTDDPVDSLEYHQTIKQNEAIQTKVLPAFRPDKAVELTRPEFNEYINKLAEVSEIGITKFEDLLKAIEKRAHYFHEHGCRLSDHGIETLPFESASYEEASQIFTKARTGESINSLEEKKYKTFTLLFLGRLYRSLGWTMQLHIGAIRNNNERMFTKLGPDTGFDSIHDFDLARPLNSFLNELDRENELPKTIIYNLNPIHNYVIATAIGNFQSSEANGKIQFGSGWWFNDQKDGMLKQMTDLANLGLLSSFVGMLTDSRSFLSYPRHEYFRRVLCDLVGGWVESGEAPRDYKLLGNMIQNISYNNADHYFEMK